jgi:hypothetical protein
MKTQTEKDTPTPHRFPVMVNIDASGNHAETASFLRTQANHLTNLANKLDPQETIGEERSEIDIPTFKKTAGKTTKQTTTKTAAKTDDFDFGTENSTDESAEEDANEGEELDMSSDDAPAEEEEETPPPAPKPAREPGPKGAKTKGPSLDDVIAGFQAYAKKHSREKAGKILAKYKITSVRDLPAAKYIEVIKLLST